MALFSVRSVIKFDDVYEERIVLFNASDFEDAIEQANDEALDYAAAIGSGLVVDFQQAYELDADSVGSGTELFSLMRSSELSIEDYITAYFDTGDEYEQDDEDDESEDGLGDDEE